MGSCFGKVNAYSSSSSSEQTDHTLTICQYSFLLHDALRPYQHLYSGDAPLMTFCFEMAFFITEPNEALIEHERNQYLSGLQPFFLPGIATLICSFLREDDYKWVPFGDKRHQSYQEQINFSRGLCCSTCCVLLLVNAVNLFNFH